LGLLGDSPTTGRENDEVNDILLGCVGNLTYDTGPVPSATTNETYRYGGVAYAPPLPDLQTCVHPHTTGDTFIVRQTDPPQADLPVVIEVSNGTPD
jgi:hypothetical protein